MIDATSDVVHWFRNMINCMYNLLLTDCRAAPHRLIREASESTVDPLPPIIFYYYWLHWFIPKSIIDSLFLHIHYWFHSTGRLPFPQVPEHYCLKIIRFVANLHCRQNSARGPFLLQSDENVCQWVVGHLLRQFVLPSWYLPRNLSLWLWNVAMLVYFRVWWTRWLTWINNKIYTSNKNHTELLLKSALFLTFSISISSSSWAMALQYLRFRRHQLSYSSIELYLVVNLCLPHIV